jgi:hypothetical protein
MGEVMTVTPRPGAGKRPGWFVVGALAVVLFAGVLLAGCGADSTDDSVPIQDAVCAVARERAADLPLGDMTVIPTASAEEIQTSLEAASAAYDAMGEVATEDFSVTLDQVKQGLMVLDAELARAGYDWSQVDMSRLSAVFTPEFDGALRSMVSYLQETCQIEVAIPTV